ncbi:MAG: hypothetical protein RBR18_03515 [Desulfovibrionaceae bacterium]|jgi:hypothetical protein|nr:hypothetical protein [Desulfovibrionaceae bacterium]
MFVFFPTMHAELLPDGVLPGVLLLDPGYDDAASEGRLRPAGLPLEPAAARALVRDSVNFGEQFQAPGDLAAYGLTEALNRNDEGSAAIQSELSRRMRGLPATQESDPFPAQAQMTLLLAWFYEERFLEMQRLEQGLAASWEAFGRGLGLEPEEEGTGEAELDRALTGMTAPVVGRPQYPWRVLLEAAAFFLPEGALLVTGEAEPASTWAEAGLAAAPLDAAAHPALAGLPAGTRVVSAPVWRLSGRRREPTGRPDLLRRLDVAVLPGEIGEAR